MPQLDYFQAHVIVDGSVLQEYPMPEENSDSEHTRTCYVEIQTGQKFHIELTWLQGFELRHAHALHAEVQIDNQSFYTFVNVDCGDLGHARGKTTTHLHRVVSSVLHKDRATRMWMRSTLKFGALGLDDNASDHNLSVDAMLQLGSIRVRFYRARKTKLDKPQWFTRAATPPIDKVPEKLLKGNPIKNNVKFEDGIVVPYAPEAVNYDYVPIKGRFGKVQEFIFLYRTRKTLQYLHVIPKSPSPAPDMKLMLDRTEETLKLSKQKEAETARREREARRENIELRERLNRLQQGGSGVKAEPSEQSMTNQGLKRALEEDGDELTEMAPPPRKPKILIDLTEDDDD